MRAEEGPVYKSREEIKTREIPFLKLLPRFSREGEGEVMRTRSERRPEVFIWGLYEAIAAGQTHVFSLSLTIKI